jgi:hypothetical protein
LHILRRYHEQAQEDRTEEGIGPQAPKAKEKSETPGEGSERESQIGKNGGGREGLPFPGFEVAQRVEPARPNTPAPISLDKQKQPFYTLALKGNVLSKNIPYSNFQLAHWCRKPIKGR